MIFQDPYASLNPRKRVGFIVAEALQVHKLGTEAEIKRRVQELLEVVGLNPEHYNRFPHEFSGGQRQRIGVARALAVNPKLIVCDEPVSALDVSVQAQILNLLKDLQRDFGLTYIFIAHDLNVVRHISDRVLVMYLGQLVEEADRTALYTRAEAPVHRARFSRPSRCRIPTVGRQRRRIVLEGDVPNPINPPNACRFHPRCPRFVEGHCDVEEPELIHRGGAARPRREVPLPARAVADDGGRDAHAGRRRRPHRRRRPPARRSDPRSLRLIRRPGAPGRAPPVLAPAPDLRGRDRGSRARARPRRRRRRRRDRSRSGGTSPVRILLVGGFFVGNRGAARPRGRGRVPASRARRFFRWADADEQQESISLSAILVALGFVLLVLGVVADRRYELF